MSGPSYERTFRTNGTVASTREPAQLRSELAITKEHVSEPETLARLLTRIVTDVRRALGGRRMRIDFEDVTCASGTDVVLEHGFGCRVRWWVVDWTGSAAPNLRRDATNTTADRLVLDCGQTGTATIRVEVV